MKIKKYEVADMKEALRLIKQDLGPDAVILTTRKIMKPAGLGLFPKPILEVTAAVDYDKSVLQGRSDDEPEIIPAKPQHTPPDPTKIIRSQTNVEKRALNQLYQPAAPTYRSPSSVNNSAALNTDDRNSQSVSKRSSSNEAEIAFTKSLLENKRAELQAAYLSAPQLRRDDVKPASDKMDINSGDKSIESFAEVLQNMGLSSIAADIGDIKKQLNEMKASMNEHVNVAVDLPENLRQMYAALNRNGLDELLSYRFLKSIEKSVSDSASKAQIKNIFIERLSESIPIEQGYLNLMKNKIMGFIGPTGVGKTTTIAKIAAELVLKHTQRVCLITVDNFRVGAVEQLKTYAEIVNLPLYVASSPQDLTRLLGNIAEQYEYILLDSTGRSPYDMNRLNETAQYLNASRDIVPVLVMSMAANHDELGEMYEKYSGLDPRYLIFTKLDETRYFGPLAGIPIKKKIPLMLLSAGQSVPDDLEIPDGKKIARKLLQEIPVLWKD